MMGPTLQLPQSKSAAPGANQKSSHFELWDQNGKIGSPELHHTYIQDELEGKTTIDAKNERGLSAGLRETGSFR